VSFLDPWADPRQDGYQLIQSFSGRLWRHRELGLGDRNKKLFYLPIQYTDFILPSLQKSLALLVAAVAAANLRDIGVNSGNQGTQCCSPACGDGAMILMLGQSLLNIGVATGVLPTTGLPLISYGGSSMIASLLVAGLLIRVAREAEAE